MLLLTGIFDGCDLSFDAAVAETAGNEDAVLHRPRCSSTFSSVTSSESTHLMLTVARLATPPCCKCLYNADVSVMQLDIFSDQGNVSLLQVGCCAGDLPSASSRSDPAPDRAGSGTHRQPRARCSFSMARGASYKIFHIQVLKNMAAGNVAEQRDLVAGCRAPGDSSERHTRISGWIPDTLQLFDACLGRLGLHLAGSLQVGNQGDVDEDGILVADSRAGTGGWPPETAGFRCLRRYRLPQ